MSMLAACPAPSICLCEARIQPPVAADDHKKVGVYGAATMFDFQPVWLAAWQHTALPVLFL